MPKVVRSTVIDAPVEAVWARIRDFNALPEWLPGVDASEIEHGRASDSIGCVRRLSLANGGTIRARLLSLSDDARSCTYTIVESALPLSDFVGRFFLRPVTDGNRTFMEWTAEFECAPELADDLAASVGTNVLQAGLDSLKRPV